MELAREDDDFLRSLCRALLALLLSAAIVVAVFSAYYQLRVPDADNLAISTTILGKQFTTILGDSRPQNNALLVTGLKAEADGPHALLSTHMVLKAQYYPYLQYKLEGLQTGLELHFFWRRAEKPGEMFSALIPRNLDALSTFNLATQPDWQGTITDIALYVSGDLRDQPLGISEITLSSGNWRLWIASVWSEWTAFRGWTPRSINWLRGAPGDAQSAAVSPTIAMALWTGLALILLYVMNYFWPTKNLISYGIAILIPWITLDQFWQSELSAQLQETKYLFSGKTIQEKHLVDVDSDIFRYTKRLKEDRLPSSPARIFILHDSWGHNFLKLKTQYYLLPHNIYNFNDWLPDQHVRSGDYILALGAVPGLSFNAVDSQLSWGGTKLSVIVLDLDPLGTLYQVRPAANIPENADKQQEETNG